MDQLLVDLADPHETRHDLTLSNNGDERLYVEATLEEILKPGTAHKQIRQGSPDELGILVTPTRLILEPHQRRVVRLVVLHRPRDAERLYTLTLRPVVGAISAQGHQDPSARRAFLKILVGYGIAIFLRPEQPHEDLKIERDGKVLQVANDGNVSIMLQDGYQCPNAGMTIEKCKKLPVKRIFPGERWQLGLSFDRPVHLTVVTEAGSHKEEY